MSPLQRNFKSRFIGQEWEQALNQDLFKVRRSFGSWFFIDYHFKHETFLMYYVDGVWYRELCSSVASGSCCCLLKWWDRQRDTARSCKSYVSEVICCLMIVLQTPVLHLWPHSSQVWEVSCHFDSDTNSGKNDYSLPARQRLTGHCGENHFSSFVGGFWIVVSLVLKSAVEGVVKGLHWLCVSEMYLDVKKRRVI